VAGLGTRFLPATKSIPKEMLPVVDKPLIQYAVEEALDAGIDTLIFITSRKKHAISDHFDTAFELQVRLSESGKNELLSRVTEIIPDHVSRVHVTQTEALGLGHAVLCAASVVGDEPFAVILADDMVLNRGPGALAQMVRLYEETGASVLGVEQIPPELTRSYGVVGVEETAQGHRRIHTIVEKPASADAPSDLGVVGRYILSADIFQLLREVKAGVGGEIQLTDGIAALLKTDTVLALPFEGRRYDCGSREGYIRATIDHALELDDLRGPILAHIREILDQLEQD
jgi:UTP--glucose-1-phosphate uridylyltransferase